MVRTTLAQRARFLGRTKKNVVLRPTEALTDGAFLAPIYPSPDARRRDQQGIELRVVEYALDTPAGPPPLLSAGLLTEVAAERLPPRRPRHNPRALERKLSNFPLKRPPPDGSPPPLPPVAVTSVRVLWP